MSGSLIFLIIWCGVMYGVFSLARKKGRNPIPWLIYAVFVPYFALPHILFAGEGAGAPVGRAPKAGPSDPVAMQQRLDAIHSGNLPQFKPQGMMLQPGEVFFFEQPAQHGQTVVDTKYVGQSGGVGIPIGGIRLNLGASQASVKSTERLAWGPQGSILASNQRLVFTAGSKGMVAIPYASIMNFEAAERGCAVTTSNMGAHQFFTGDPCLGVLLQRIVDAIHGGTEYAALAPR